MILMKLQEVLDSQREIKARFATPKPQYTEDNVNGWLNPPAPVFKRLPVWFIECQEDLRLLGVDTVCTRDDIRQAWYKALKACHPDKVGARGHELAVDINSAYNRVKAVLEQYNVE